MAHSQICSDLMFFSPCSIRHFVFKSPAFKFPSYSRTIHLLHAAMQNTPLGNRGVEEWEPLGREVLDRSKRIVLKNIDRTTTESNIGEAIDTVVPGVLTRPSAQTESFKSSKDPPSIPEYELHETSLRTNPYQAGHQGERRVGSLPVDYL